jgi:hypothetical protein
VFCALPYPSRQMKRQYLRLDYERFLPYPLQLFIH